MKLNRIVSLAYLTACLLVAVAFRPATEILPDALAQGIRADTTRGIDPTTGFVIADGIELMRVHCTGCHSSKLITQYRASREVWLDKIRWMQQKQNLWDLGEAEPKILDYLAKYYAPTDAYERRSPLKTEQWYKLTPGTPKE
jgi:hypothetical protein